MSGVRAPTAARVLAAALGLVACAGDPGPPGAVQGEPCGRTGDCVAGLRCDDRVCVPHDGEDPDGACVADGAKGATFAPKRLHRLNRAEYDNAVRDLLGDRSGPAQDFPADDHGYGFDNIADVLAVSPLLVEKWEAAARSVVEAAIRVPPKAPVTWRVEAEDVGSDVGILRKGTTWKLTDVGEIALDVVAPGDGPYRFSVRAFELPAGDAPATMVLTLDGGEIGRFEVATTEDFPDIFSVEAPVTYGPRLFAAVFDNPFHDPDAQDSSRRTRSLVLDWLKVEGPMDAGEPAGPSVRDGLLACPGVDADDAQGCARQAVARFARRAWRRTPTDAELDELLALRRQALELSAQQDEAMSWMLQAVLMSPAFLFRVEAAAPEGPAGPLSEPELASRLAFFLWSAPPDDALLDLAERDELSGRVPAQVDRMLADPRSEALIDNLAGQWLFTRALDRVDPDYALYASFSEELRAAMRGETEAFFRAFLTEDRDALDMLDAQFTFVDAVLAAHYGLPDPPAPEDGFVRVDVGGTVRQGLLTQASVLSVTSRRTRTSIVKRGWWVLRQLLCDEPPPPPPDIPPLPDEEAPSGLRARLEQHRADPRCAGCHDRMDPVGYALENYDAIGAWRAAYDDGQAIDPRGVLVDGAGADLPAFEGALELARTIKADPGLSQCMVRQVFTYAMGRGPAAADRCELERIRQDWRGRGGSLRDLLGAVVDSAPFTQRAGGTAP